jgi:LmbE family N-acetylglucosaminyl deacetylase
VLAAHPDDEVVGAAVLLARSRGGRVIHLTDGAPRDRRLWPRAFARRSLYVRLRRVEAARALALAGIDRERIHPLGGIDQEAPRALSGLARELAALLARLRPPVLVLHPYEGGHPDHDAAALVGRAAAAMLARAGLDAPQLVEMTSYHGANGSLATGAFLPDPAPQVEILASRAESALKRHMLAAHESQAATLALFPSGPERFRRAPPADFSRPPHPGETYSEKMGWMRGEQFRCLAATALEELALPPLLVRAGGHVPSFAAGGRR